MSLLKKTGWIAGHMFTAYIGIPALLAAIILSNGPYDDDWSMIIVYWLLITPVALVPLAWGAAVGVVSSSATSDVPQPQRWLPLSLLACVSPLALLFLL